MVYVMIKHRNKPVLSNKESWMQENELNNFRTIVSEVSSFVGNPVDGWQMWLQERNKFMLGWRWILWMNRWIWWMNKWMYWMNRWISWMNRWIWWKNRWIWWKNRWIWWMNRWILFQELRLPLQFLEIPNSSKKLEKARDNKTGKCRKSVDFWGQTFSFHTFIGQLRKKWWL